MHKVAITMAVIGAFASAAALAEEKARARLVGYQEVPSVSTPASGEFRAVIGSDEQSVDYELSYRDIVGTVQQAHIHFAQRGVNGSIVVWLCQTATTPAPAAVAGLTPFCPQSGTVTGTFTAANVITAATASQMIVGGELAEVLAALRAGVTYANVHATPLNPGGEIRGQIRTRHGEREDDD